MVRDSAGEALEFTRATAVSGVGAGTLDHLEAVLTDLDLGTACAPWADAS